MKKNSAMMRTCHRCESTPQYVQDMKEIAKLRQRLIVIAGEGHYYRGEDCQLSEFRLFQCPECSTYYEDGHHYYADPESTMGLARDEEDWYVMCKLNVEEAVERLRQLG